jgi:ATP synthase protein I
MFRVVVVQLGTVLVVSILAAALYGQSAAVSSFLGGLACVLPNALFAAHLAANAAIARPPGARMLRLLLGELSKVLLVTALLLAVIRGIAVVHWPALVLSVCAVLLVQPFAIAWRSR